MFKKEVKDDLKALGGLPIYLLTTFAFYLTDYKEAALVLLLGLIIGYALAIVLRLLFWRRRPDKESYHNLISKIDAGSFPSLHSMRVAMLATVIMMRFQSIVSYLIFGAAALSVLVLRVTERRHYPRDVIAGAILGVLIIIGLIFTALLL